jgi:hypothetical protein
MRKFFNISFINDLVKRKNTKLAYFYVLIFISLLLIFLLTVINTKSPFFEFAKDERILKNVNHFYPQYFAYFTIQPDSVEFVNVFKIRKDNTLKKIDIQYTLGSNYYGLSRRNKYSFVFFGNIYKYIPDKNEYIIDDIRNLSTFHYSDDKFTELTFGNSYFCGKYIISLRDAIPFESRNLENLELPAVKYKLVNIKCE